MNNGIIIYNVRDYQKAIDLAGQEFRARYHVDPGSVALPNTAPTNINLYGLPQNDTPAPPGTIIMWPKKTCTQDNHHA